jgi:hypothetical protein
MNRFKTSGGEPANGKQLPLHVQGMCRVILDSTLARADPDGPRQGALLPANHDDYMPQLLKAAYNKGVVDVHTQHKELLDWPKFKAWANK